MQHLAKSSPSSCAISPAFPDRASKPVLLKAMKNVLFLDKVYETIPFEKYGDTKEKEEGQKWMEKGSTFPCFWLMV